MSARMDSGRSLTKPGSDRLAPESDIGLRPASRRPIGDFAITWPARTRGSVEEVAHLLPHEVVLDQHIQTSSRCGTNLKVREAA